jgi:hypothetical protein
MGSFQLKQGTSIMGPRVWFFTSDMLYHVHIAFELVCFGMLFTEFSLAHGIPLKLLCLVLLPTASCSWFAAWPACGLATCAKVVGRIMHGGVCAGREDILEWCSIRRIIELNV